MNVSIVETNAMAPAAGYMIDSAGGASGSDWKFSSLSHVAIAADPTNATKCVPDLPLDGPTHCHADIKSKCHGIQPSTNVQLETTCLDVATCACNDVPECRDPVIRDLAIDPRNGFVYASTDTGRCSRLTVADRGRAVGATPGPKA